MTDINTMLQGIVDLNIELDDMQKDKFIQYKEMLKEWNEKINITAIVDDKEIDIKHFLDSLTPSILNIFNGSQKIIDIGTGGGFPGLPLKIIYPNLNVTLLDSLNKRIIFLNEVINSLHLKDIQAIHGRAEELGRKEEYREVYDICVSRAVASLDTLSEYCIPFVKNGGYFLSMKGPDVEEELENSKNAIEKLGGRILKIEKIQIPESDIVHSLILIKKIRETPTKYPRAGGKPKKNPL